MGRQSSQSLSHDVGSPDDSTFPEGASSVAKDDDGKDGDARARQQEGVDALRVAGHDLKTPLTVLRTLAQLFKMGLDKGTLATQPERTARNCQLMIDQVDKLTMLADNLLDVARAYSGRLKVEKHFSDLRPIIRDSVKSLGNAPIKLKMPDKPIMGSFDLVRLRQVFSHVLAEIKEGDVIVSESPDHVKITVSGNLKANPKGESPGIYLAKAIVELHGGQMWNQYEITLPLN